MCRNIRTLFNFEPPATDDEIRASALQFVRKLSGFVKPSRANEAAFSRAVDRAGRKISRASSRAGARAVCLTHMIRKCGSRFSDKIVRHRNC